MSRKSHFTTKDDVALLRWWREWLHALDAEMAATDQGNEERRHKRVEMLQRTIANTPSEGLIGLGVKLALASFLDSFADGADGEPAMLTATTTMNHKQTSKHVPPSPAAGRVRGD